MFPVPPLFNIIKIEPDTDWKEMYRVFNMGHRMELYLPEKYAAQVIEISESFGIQARIIGRCEKSENKQLLIESEFGTFTYDS